MLHPLEGCGHGWELPDTFIIIFCRILGPGFPENLTHENESKHINNE